MSRRASRRRGTIVVVAGVVGAGIGAIAAPWLHAHVGGPQPPDASRYTIIVPGGRDGVVNTVLTGSGVVDGSLALITREFGRKDLLAVHTPAPVARFELDLALDSAPVAASIRDEAGTVTQILTLGAGAWASPNNTVTRPWSTPGHAVVDVKDGRVRAEGRDGGIGTVGQLELRPEGTVHIDAIRAWGVDGTPLIDDSFRADRASLPIRTLWMIVCSTVATSMMFVAASARSGPGGVLAVAVGLGPPLLVLRTPYTTIRETIERLYLGTTAPGDLRATLLAASLLPLGAMTVLATGWLVVQGDRPARRGVWGGLIVLAALLATHPLRGWDHLWFVPGLVVLALPMWGARRAGQSTHAVMVRELPVLVAVAVLGWGPGLLLGLLWRLLFIVANAATLATTAAAAGVDLLVIYGLLLVPATEVTLRQSSAGAVWRPDALAGASLGLGADAAARFEPFWTGDCGAKVIDVFGGSSTGGAYQFRTEPEAFFPARLHAALCAEGVGVRTHNYGNSGRDTWDAAHAASTLFAAEPPTVVIVYAGVNDLLTADAPLTRKQQAEQYAARSAAVGTLARLGESSRIITGLTLWSRPRAEGKLVPAVPLADAEENLRLLAGATHAAGGTLILVPEIVVSRQAKDMAKYVDMERRLATELPATVFVDPAGVDWDPLLVDRNHLGEEGSEQLAELLQPVVRGALGP